MIRSHRYSHMLVVRFVGIFVAAFAVFFVVLNIRFLTANARFLIAPGTISNPSSLSKALKTLPLAGDIDAQPLPSHARLVIDSIGVDAPIVFGVPGTEESIYRNLEHGVVHYSGTPKPGPMGVSVILGHSSAYPWYRGNYGSVFALLGKLQPGDKFYIQYEDGRLFLYTVKQSIVFNPFASDERLTELEHRRTPTLVLVSCWPVGTNFRRIAVEAERISL